MIRTTRWSPDSCGCSMEYTWDDAVPDNARIHTFKAAPVICPAHQAIATPLACYNAVLGENVLKNRVFDTARAALNVPIPTQADWVSASIGVITPAMESFRRFERAVRFSYDAQRILHVSLVGFGLDLTPPQKPALQAAIDTAHGAGKALVD